MQFLIQYMNNIRLGKLVYCFLNVRLSIEKDSTKEKKENSNDYDIELLSLLHLLKIIACAKKRYR